jgi:hypothetical protein
MKGMDITPAVQTGPPKPWVAAGGLGQGSLEPRKRRPLWSQVTLGCCAVLLVVLGILAGVGTVIHRKGTIVMERSWKELRTTAERLRTVESTKALYRSNPGLSEIYATEGAFLKQAETWRPKLGDIPSSPPSLKVLFQGKPILQVHENRSDGHETVRMKYAFPSGVVLELESDQGKLTDLLLK